VMRRTAILFSLGLLANAAAAYSQSLADVARQEAERRKSVNSQARVYTNEDLGAPAPAPAGAPTAPSAGSTPAKKASAESDSAAKGAATAGGAEIEPPTEKAKSEPNKFRDEQHWRERARSYRDKLDKLRSDVAAIQSRVESLRAGAQTPANASELKLAEQDLVKYKNQLGYIEKEWSGIEQKAREDNVPATWLQ
jgi:hypothetical protein